MKGFPVLRWLLRTVVVLQCLGHARWFLRLEMVPIGQTPLLSFLLAQHDAGGLALAESTGLFIEQVIGWCLVVAAGLTLVRPCWPVLVPVAVLQAVIACCMMRMDVGFSPTWALPSHALRIAAPLALVLVNPWRKALDQTSPADPRLRAAETLMRWAAALTFIGHGMDAWWQSPPFQNLISATTFRWLDILPEQAHVEAALGVIAVVDIAAAVLVVTVRWRPVAWWMAFWGLITASSRITAFGFLPQYHEILIRAAHCGIPVALALYWTWRKASCALSASTQPPMDRAQPPEEASHEMVRTS